MAEPSSLDEGKAALNPRAKAKSKMKLVAMGKGEDGEGDLEQEYMLIVVGHGYSPNRVEQIPLDQGKVLSYTSVGQKLYSSQAKQVLDRLRDGQVMRCVEGDPESEPPLPALELYTQPREIANYTVAFQDPELANALECELGYYIFNPHHKGDKVMPLKKFCADCNPRREYATIRDLRFLLEAVTNHTQAPISHILYLACKDIVDKIPNAIKANIDKTINMELKLQEHSSQQMPMEEKDLQKIMEKTISALKKEALGLGATNDEVSQCLDTTERKAALVELICSKQPASSTACRDATLLSMSVSELELQARNLGAPETEIDEALDGEDIHASLVDLLFKHQMAREAALQRQTRYIFVGNPATGKSTLLNAFLGGEKARFKSSDRVDGFTSVMKEYYCPEQNATFVDTPGLNDSSIFERARHEISMAFQGKGKSKLVFVFNHQANRCQEDIITLRNILIAFEKAEELHYGVIVNKHVVNAASEKFMLDLKKKLEDGGRGRHGVSVTYFEFQVDISKSPDVKPTLPEDLRTFLEKLPPIDLNKISVESIGGGGLKEQQQTKLEARQLSYEKEAEEKRKQEIEAPSGSGMRAAKTLNQHEAAAAALTQLADKLRISVKDLKSGVIDLQTRKDIDDSIVQELAHHCPNLEKIDLMATKVGDPGVKEIARRCPNLREIALYATQVGDAGAKDIATNCPNLQVIGLAQTAVTDEGVKDLLQNCPKLVYLIWKEGDGHAEFRNLKKKYGI